MTSIPNRCTDDNRQAQSDPEYLVIHCPRVVQVSPWGEWAEATLADLKRWGWIERRERDAVNIIWPGHPASLQ
jgi:hypothetical protein